MQYQRKVGGSLIVNAGSVGMPYGPPGAFWALLGPGVSLRHTSYNFAGAAETIRGCPYPDGDAFADDHILRPPSAAEAIEVLETEAERRARSNSAFRSDSDPA